MLQQDFQIYNTFWIPSLLTKKKTTYPQSSQNALYQVAKCQHQKEKNNHELHDLSQDTKQHARFTSCRPYIKQGKSFPYSQCTKKKSSNIIELSAFNNQKKMQIDETLKVAMDVIEKRTHSLTRANKSWNIPMNSFFYHLNGKTKSKKMAPRGVLT